ncbi:prepilin-type N-terminal cleavage/methylation domain-containing protein [Ideonella dechloratans]|uniref:Prepilin-type N-terminal cleavage/methylation domain-containing protein n=1 Tax=Ideonella dechloratans TaxID=36863 RepID=A0A643FA48_IDEDE|nr:prepilin-type N-terminal cleavage/methylation domain-containing protein [Ideonella dechloratans]KAB0580580.1 prepilin-type N-terminal cleavage/methylation domain-containing protein [Ideonella dechloratans]UFU09472.1 prepilin-type N-terminal cleavage/methylation domain-containing protein [Ideonella dechloratans]
MPSRVHTAPPRHPLRGFTLVEVLVALFIMAVLAMMAWRGIDALVRSRDGAQGNAQQILLLSTTVNQWEQDLAQLQRTPGVPALKFDGAALRLTRRAKDGMVLVVWTMQGDTLYRWASPATSRVAELQEWWMRSQQWSGIREGALPMLSQLSEWQVYYYRQGDNTWSNAQSSAGRSNAAPVAGAPSTPGGSGDGSTPPDTTSDEEDADQLPQGVRLVLRLPAGPLTRDVLLSGDH